MNIDNTVRVELDDDDIREAIEQFVRIKLSTGPGTAKLTLSLLRIWDPHAVRADDEAPRAIDYGLSASLQFEPTPEPVKREAKD